MESIAEVANTEGFSVRKHANSNQANLSSKAYCKMLNASTDSCGALSKSFPQGFNNIDFKFEPRDALNPRLKVSGSNIQPSRQGPPSGVKGIDVSKHQGLINWSKVVSDKDAAIQFALIRASYGHDGKYEKFFARNWVKAREAGLIVGAYHYFGFCRIK